MGAESDCPGRAANVTDRVDMTHTSRLTIDGCQLAHSSEGSGPPVVLIQGVGVHGHAWRPQIDGLASRYECLWFDNRGVGASQPPSRQLTVAQMATDVIALLDARGWASAHLVGHSLGGLVAQRVALTTPGRVRSLSLLCTFARGRDAGASARMAWIGLRSRVGTKPMRRAAFLEILAPPQALATADRAKMAADLAPLFGHDLADHSAIEMQQLKAMRGENTLAELARLSAVPTLVVSAAHDPIAPPALGRQLAAAIPGARYEEFADQAHGAPILAAARINTLVLDHLDAAERHVRRGV